MTLTATDLRDLRRAKRFLEHPNLATKLQDALGRPIEEGTRWLPAKWRDTLNQSVETALRKALDFALLSIDDRTGKTSANAVHKLLVAASGAAGGAFGLPALPMELPVSTVIMLRSIADIARSEGEDIRSVEAKLACLEVFALGGRGTKDSGLEKGYFALRTILTRQVSEAAKFLAERGIAEQGAPAVARFIAAVASRFGLVVSEKVAAAAIPVLGAAGGALINTIFIDHFQDTARGHFIVRRLERTYGADEVKKAYQEMKE